MKLQPCIIFSQTNIGVEKTITSFYTFILYSHINSTIFVFYNHAFFRIYENREKNPRFILIVTVWSH